MQVVGPFRNLHWGRPGFISYIIWHIRPRGSILYTIILIKVITASIAIVVIIVIVIVAMSSPRFRALCAQARVIVGALASICPCMFQEGHEASQQIF